MFTEFISDYLMSHKYKNLTLQLARNWLEKNNKISHFIVNKSVLQLKKKKRIVKVRNDAKRKNSVKSSLNKSEILEKSYVADHS